MSIDLMPTERNSEIRQNVRIITTTIRGTQPLDRGLGLDGGLVDAAGSRGNALLAADIITALPAAEPRINVTRVGFAGEAVDGSYEPTIEYEVLD